ADPLVALRWIASNSREDWLSTARRRLRDVIMAPRRKGEGRTPTRAVTAAARAPRDTCISERASPRVVRRAEGGAPRSRRTFPERLEDGSDGAGPPHLS